jgi:hypothetical protein
VPRALPLRLIFRADSSLCVAARNCRPVPPTLRMTCSAATGPFADWIAVRTCRSYTLRPSAVRVSAFPLRPRLAGAAPRGASLDTLAVRAAAVARSPPSSPIVSDRTIDPTSGSASSSAMVVCGGFERTKATRRGRRSGVPLAWRGTNADSRRSDRPRQVTGRTKKAGAARACGEDQRCRPDVVPARALARG